MKRLFDILSSGIALLLFSPLFVVIAILIQKEDRGSVFFTQTRVGKHGVPFEMYKFRSMVMNASEIGPHFTSQDDPRITKIGAFLRKSSLDELPQLLNVLRGDMSVVGPRPNVPKQVDEYTPEDWDKRNQVQPGITGLAQATKRSAATPEERTRLDLEYVDRHGFWFDMKIIFWTVGQVLGKGSF